MLHSEEVPDLILQVDLSILQHYDIVLVGTCLQLMRCPDTFATLKP